jgi:hypothetical protein
MLGRTLDQSPIRAEPVGCSPFDAVDSPGDISAADISAIFSPSFFSPEQKGASVRSKPSLTKEQTSTDRFSSAEQQDAFCGIASKDTQQPRRSMSNTSFLNDSNTTAEDVSIVYGTETEEDGSGLHESLLLKFNSCDVQETKARETGADSFESASKRKR